MRKKIILLAGSVKSGKTSRLLSFIQSRQDAGGILAPLINGKKYLLNIQSGKMKLLEAEDDEPESTITTIGRYRFKTEIFEWGREVLRNAYWANTGCLIIDEIGPLELEGKGLSPAADEIINTFSTHSKNLIIVVRNSLTGKFFEHFQIDKSAVDYFSEHNI